MCLLQLLFLPAQQSLPSLLSEAIPSLPQQDFAFFKSQQDLPSLAAQSLASWLLQHSIPAEGLPDFALPQVISPEDFPAQQAIEAWSCFSVFSESGAAVSWEQQVHPGMFFAGPGEEGVAGGADVPGAGCCPATGSHVARAKIRNADKTRILIDSPNRLLVVTEVGSTSYA